MAAEIANFWTGICVVGAFAFLLAILFVVGWRLLGKQLTRMGLAVFCLGAGIATVEAQKRLRAPRGETRGGEEVAGAQQEVVQDGNAVICHTNLYVSAIEVTPTNVELVASWPLGLFSGDVTLDILATWPTLTNGWQWLYAVQVPAGVTNGYAEILPSDLNMTNMPSALFVKVQERNSAAATMDDFDNDGLPGFYERHYGTNPYVADSASVPKLTVGANGEYSSIQDALNASGEYSVVEVQTVQSGQMIDLPAHPVMIAGPSAGYAHIISEASPYLFSLGEGQDSRTIFQNLFIELERSRNVQAAFWCGKSLPIGITNGTPPAAATFRNIYLKVNEGDGARFGWYVRGRTDDGVLIDHCVVNASGATNYIGVCSVDSPDLKLNNCTFVNFPPVGAGSSGEAVHVESVDTNAQAAIDVAIVKTVFDDSFTNALPLTRSGGLMRVSVKECLLPSGFSTGNEPDIAENVIIGSNVVTRWGYAIPGAVSDIRGIGAVAAVGEASTLDTDMDGLADWDEAYRYGTNPFVADTDGDGVDDSHEVERGSDALNPMEFAIATKMQISDVTLMSNHVVYAAYEGLPSSAIELDIGQGLVSMPLYFVTNRVLPRVVFSNSLYSVSSQITIAGGDFAVTTNLDNDKDGINDLWELSAGLCPNNAADLFADSDGDGLIALHEFWAATDPYRYDGTNTALYAAVHGVDDRLMSTDSSSALPIYLDYKDNVRTNTPPTALPNPSSCFYDILSGRFSLWNDSIYYFMHPLCLISELHVIVASHCENPTNKVYKFRGRSGQWYSRLLLDKRAIPDTDITVGMIDAPLPCDDVPITGLLPDDYMVYLGDLKYLPVVQVDQDKNALVQEIQATVKPTGRYNEFSCGRSTSELRASFYQSMVTYDSGSPCFLVIGDDPVLLYAAQGRHSSGSGAGYHTTLFIPEIQSAMDEMSDINAKPRKVIKTFDFSRYPRLHNGGY